MKSLALLVVILVAFAALVRASSHGEAPGVLANPPSDATDLYAFRSYEPGREKYVTLLALYNPLQQPIAGPNYFPLSNDYFYDILIDNDGDGVEEYRYTFDVSSELEDDGGLKVPVGPKGKKISVPLKVIGQIDASKSDFSSILNYRDTYTLTLTDRKAKSTKTVREAGSKNSVFTIPFDNAGEKTIPNYSAYARKYIYDIDIPNCDREGKVFVGQRQEPFFIALGETFDLVNYQGNRLPLAGVPGGLINSKSNNDIGGFNIDVLGLEIPIKCLAKDSDVIGVWTRTRSKSSGRQNQRLGNPLVNELIIGLEDKDKWNKVTPKDDRLFKDYFKYPAIAELLNILFAQAAGADRISPTNFPRKDIHIALQKGLPGLNRLSKDDTVADMLRLNTSIPVTSTFSQNNLGVAGGDLAGYPNGRRPGDDIVDISLRVVMGLLCHTPFGPALDCGPSDAPTGTLPFSDGADGDATDFQSRFPYLNDPLPGARIF